MKEKRIFKYELQSFEYNLDLEEKELQIIFYPEINSIEEVELKDFERIKFSLKSKKNYLIKNIS